ncbi:MAG TPA: ANTAR domain-containing protein [Pseudonocardiaceae bacterium]|jgi:NAD(P) transhydrogenase subunit alpha
MSTVVGVVAETRPGERRTALVPVAVTRLVESGFRVLVESGCGSAAGFADADFARAGAVIVESGDVFARSRVIACVTTIRRPARLHRGHIMVGMLQPWRYPVLIEHWVRRGVSVVGLDSRARIAEAHGMEATTTQGRIAGREAARLAEWHFGGYFPMIAPDGTVRPVTVLVLGAGVAGLQAMSTARLLGAQVTGYTGRANGRTAITSRGARFLELGSPPVERDANDQQRRARRHLLDARIHQFDVIITAAGTPGRRPPRLVSELAIAGMRRGSVIVDVAASRYGGNVAGSRPGTTTTLPSGVRLIGAGNLAAQAPGLASEYYADNVVAAVQELCATGEPLIDLSDPLWSATVLGHDGRMLPPERVTARPFGDLAGVQHGRGGAAERLSEVLNSRTAIEQAKGVLAERLGIGVAAAFTMLCDDARRHHLPLGELADRVLDDDPAVRWHSRAERPAR